MYSQLKKEFNFAMLKFSVARNQAILLRLLRIFFLHRHENAVSEPERKGYEQSHT